MSTLPVHFQNEALKILDFECDPDDVENENYLPDINDQQTPLERLLLSENFKLLHDILEELREVDTVKWEDVTVHDIFPDMLRDSKLLFERCRIQEIAHIGKVLESYTGRSFYSTQLSQSRNVNIIWKMFEGSNFIQENKKIRQASINSMKTLVQLSKGIILNSLYPTVCLQVLYANALHKVAKSKWIQEAKIPLIVTIPRNLLQKPPVDFQIFCFPEYSEKREQLEPRILDYSHILMNMQMHLCKTGYNFCKGEHFVKLCQERPDILSQAILIPKLDPMNIFTTVRFFSKSVEQYMTNKGYTNTAYFIKLVRNWNRACDKRGMTADEGVEHMLNFFCYLTEGINFDTFPSVSTQRYIHGMQIQTFEAILHNISTCVSLYALVFGENYNTRSVSTLVIESCNSDIH